VKRIGILFLLVLPVWATAFQVELITSKTECFEGESVRIEIHVFPAKPSGTVLLVESVPDGFSLAGSRKERRSREDDSPFSEGRVNSVVFVQEWTGSQAGSYRLGPFIVQVNGIEQMLAPVDILVLERETVGMGELRWTLADPEAVIRSGDSVSLILEARYIHEPVSLDVPLPKNALLDKSGEYIMDHSYSGSEWRPVASFLWTPLFDGNLHLPFVELEYRDRIGTSSRAQNLPRIIPVVEQNPDDRTQSASPRISEAFTSVNGEDTEEELSVREYPLPESLRNPRVPALALAAGYWQDKQYADALAHIRRLEYTNLFPAAIRRARLEAEQMLGISATVPVPSKPALQLVLLFFLIFVAISLVLLIQKHLFRRGSRLLIVTCGISAILLIAVLVLLFPVLKSSAVCMGGALRQIPEDTAGITSTITEGTPVTIIQQTGSWYYVRLPEALEGWIPHDELILYTSEGINELW